MISKRVPQLPNLPVKYFQTYASQEKNFTLSDSNYDILSNGEMAQTPFANFTILI